MLVFLHGRWCREALGTGLTSTCTVLQAVAVSLAFHCDSLCGDHRGFCGPLRNDAPRTLEMVLKQMLGASRVGKPGNRGMGLVEP